MSFSNIVVSNQYTGNGADLTFNITFTFLEGEDQIGVAVYETSGVDPVEVTPTPAFTIDEGAQQVIFTVAPISTEEVVIYRDSASVQEVEYNDYRFPHETIERHWDRVFLKVQELDKMMEIAGIKDYYSILPQVLSGYLAADNNLSDVDDAITSLNNLGGLAASNNLTDVADTAASLTNLGGLAITSNLSDINNAATALANLSGLDTTNVVTQLDAEAGIATDSKVWTAERVKQAIVALAPSPVMSYNVVSHTIGVLASVANDLVYLSHLTNSVTIQLPAAPTEGNEVVVKEASGAIANKTVDGNGNTIIGVGATYAIQSTYESLRFVYSSAGWLII